jgi:hypothetical protein
MADTDHTMKEVLQRLREQSSKAVEEAGELAAAVTEILRAQERLEAGVRELSAESSAILMVADDATAPRLRNLATYAAHLGESFGLHVAAFRELKKGLDGWTAGGAQP